MGAATELSPSHKCVATDLQGQAVLDRWIADSGEMIAVVGRNFALLAFSTVYAAAFEAAFGRPPAVGLDLREAAADRVVDRALAPAHWARALAGEQVTIEACSGPGTQGFELVYRPVRDADGAIIGAALRGRQPSQGSRAAARPPREGMLQAVLEAAGLGAWERDLGTGRLELTENCLAYLGLPPGSRPSFEQIQALCHPDDRQRLTEAMHQAVVAGNDFDLEMRIIKPDGSLRWMMTRGRSIRDATGRPVSVAGVIVDITEGKRVEEQQRLRLHELGHRIKNILSVVQAVASQTGLRARSLPQFMGTFRGRLMALATAHRLLLDSTAHGADLATLAQAVVGPLVADPDRLVVDLPVFGLAAAACQNLALVLHELATNAAKHGALAAPAGRIELEGRIKGDELTLIWREIGGPPVAPPQQRGFGTTLLQQVVQRQHLGQFELDWRPQGLVCTIRLPVAEIGAQGGAPRRA